MGEPSVIACLFALLATATAKEGPPPVGSAADESDARARELFESGAQLYQDGLYEDAITAWRESYRLSRRPILLYNIASGLERIGAHEEAIDTLYRYLAFAPAEERELIEERMRELEERIESGAASQAQSEAWLPGDADPTLPPNVGFSIAMYTVTAAGLTAGTLFALTVDEARDLAASECVSLAGSVTCSSAAEDALARDKRNSYLADASFAVATVALAAGTYNLIVGRRVSAGVGPWGRGARMQLHLDF